MISSGASCNRRSAVSVVASALAVAAALLFPDPTDAFSVSKTLLTGVGCTTPLRGDVRQLSRLLVTSSSLSSPSSPPLLRVSSQSAAEKSDEISDEEFFAALNNDDEEDDEWVVLYSDDDVAVPPSPEIDDGNAEEEDLDVQQKSVPWKKNARWNSLHPKVKLHIIKEAQERAIANKKKRESKDTKKRRMLFHYKQAQLQKKRAARVKRSIPFTDRTPLTALAAGMEVTGTVISLTNFGVYVDVGTECDGLLHISKISNTDFIEHPREVFSPGDEVTVRVARVSPELKKLQLTMLPLEAENQAGEDDDDDSDLDRIPLEEIDADDELWGEIKRVTSYGAYVELGAEVDGFLHFMDHPRFGVTPGAPPSDFMKVGDRVRVWVSDVDVNRGRIKLTANRPVGLPGPQFERITFRN